MASDTWQNWAGTQSAAPRRFATPTNTRELSSLVAEAASRGQRVKAVGAGHSFTGVAVTDGVLVSLDNLSGIDSITPTDDGALVTVFLQALASCSQRRLVATRICDGKSR